MLPQAVTTVWRTELGTTLVFGFSSTTEESAYFHYLCDYQSATNRGVKKSSSPVWNRGTRALCLWGDLVELAFGDSSRPDLIGCCGEH